LEKALQAAERHKAKGVSFCPLKGGRYGVLDLDDCLDERGELIDASLEPLVSDGYCEVSPSGKGLHVFFLNTTGYTGIARTSGVEVFASKGHVTFTRKPWRELRPPCALSARAQSTLDGLVSRARDSRLDAERKETRNIPSPLAPRLREVIRALRCTDPDLPYPDWIGIGQALHSGDPTKDGRGFRLWLRWSQRGVKFANTSESEMARKWEGFHPGGGITLATLFHIAKQYGYDGSDGKRSSVGDALIMVSAKDIPMRNVRWMWPNRIPYGMLTLLAGEGGVGKGTVCAHLVACATGGLPWPDHDEVLHEILGPDAREPFDVLWFGVEDAPHDVIVPRCVAAGAVRGRVHFAQGVREEGVTAQFNLADDLQKLESALRANPRIKMVILDPITAYLGSRHRYARRMDSHNAADLRGILSPLSVFAARMGVVVIGITHLNKSTEREFVHRVLGSGAWTQVARKVYAFCKVPGSDEEFVMLDVKGNVGQPSVPLRYRIVSATADAETSIDERVRTSRIEWIGPDPTITIEQLTGRRRGPVPSTRAVAAEWLRDLLAQGPMAARTVKEQAEAAGIAEHTLRNARKEVCEVIAVDGVTMYRLRGQQTWSHQR
jgi:hypothetical protein